MPGDDSALEELIGREVVLDMASMYVILGTLEQIDHRYFILADADVHDLRDSSTTRELYVRDAHQHGITATRKRAYALRGDVVSLSLLDDVLS